MSDKWKEDALIAKRQEINELLADPRRGGGLFGWLVGRLLRRADRIAVQELSKLTEGGARNG